ncbi:MAG: hypothetical protein Q8J70_01690 [Thiobacillus sp.]|nr:hypothetical protein [Thiobacillus sp.]
MERLLPLVEFREADYLQHGGGDVVKALRNFAEAKGLHRRQAFLLVTEGMWGGYGHIAAARDFLFSTLYQSRFAARNLMHVSERLHPDKPVIAMHVRLGDFAPPPDTPELYRGRFNCSLPLEWYCNVAQSIYSRLGDSVQFLVVSDGTREQLQPLLDTIPAVTTSDLPDSDCSDLLALAKADLLVCSVSSYSSIAAFLSNAPYLWFEPNLQMHDEGLYSIWGHEAGQRRQGSATHHAIQYRQTAESDFPGRGTPVGIQGDVPEAVLRELMKRKQKNNPLTDLVRYGVVPVGIGSAGMESAPCT